MFTYSSRIASFNAAKSAADWRRLTGLDNYDGNTDRKFGSSFPQPEDVNEEDEGSQGDNGRDAGKDPGMTQREGMEVPGEQNEPISSAQINMKGKGIGGASPRTLQLPIDAQKKAGQSSSSEAKSFATTTGTSFVTARESFGSSPQSATSEGCCTERDPTEQGLPAIEEDEVNRYSGSTAGLLGDVGGGLRKSGSGDDSTSSLLRHEWATNAETSSPTDSRPMVKIDSASQKDDQTPSAGDGPSEQRNQDKQVKKSRSKHVLLELPAEAYQDEASGQIIGPSSALEAEPVSTGLVRFHIPDELAHKGHKAKGKVFQAKSRASLQVSRRTKAEPGQLLKAERMLVRIDSTKHELPDNYSENDSLKAETTTIEKWREFIVTCRRSGSEEGEYVIQMSTTRVISLLDKERQSKKSTHEIVLQQKVTKVNMFSSLDKTIVIWAPRRKETRIYLFRPRSSASSVEWYTFFNFILGWRSPSKLRIHVPDLDVNLELSNPLQDADVLREPTDRSLAHEQPHEKVADLADGRVAREIINRSLEVLKKSDFEDVVEAWEAEGEKIGLAWKRYDRLEWVHGANEERMYGSMAMQKTHDLELRPKRHYPTHVAKQPSTIIEEPSPVEGFLVRQTSQKGTHKRFGKTFFKRLYFSTHNHFLCFSEPGKALPPKPQELLGTEPSGLPRASEIAKMVPLIYNIDPFPLEEGRVRWLSNAHVKQKRHHDQLAYEEKERSLNLMLEAEGYINLCHAVQIRRSKSPSPPPPEQGQGAPNEDSEENESPISKLSEDELRAFEIVLRNGLVLRLQAFSKETRKKWVQSLRDISEYWKLRTTEDMGIYRQVRQSNLDNLNIDEEMESFIGLEGQKWEVSRSVASPELFHMCGISCCRQVTVSKYPWASGAPLTESHRCLECCTASPAYTHPSGNVR